MSAMWRCVMRVRGGWGIGADIFKNAVSAFSKRTEVTFVLF